MGILEAANWRFDVIRNKDSPCCLTERLTYVLFDGLAKQFTHPLIIGRHIRLDEAGDEYSELGDVRLYYDTERISKNRRQLQIGVGSIVIESFMRQIYFDSTVGPKTGDVAFDLGAFIGSQTLQMSKIVGDSGYVYSFEPVAYRTLKKNLEVNGLSNCKVVPEAVSNVDGEACIEITDSLVASRIISSEKTKGPSKKIQRIPTITLDHFAENEKIQKVDFIKMDIEGAEELAILGSERIIKKFRPKWSIASYHRDSENDLQHLKLVKLLRSYGYKTKERDSTHIFAF